MTEWSLQLFAGLREISERASRFLNYLNRKDADRVGRRKRWARKKDVKCFVLIFLNTGTFSHLINVRVMETVFFSY